MKSKVKTRIGSLNYRRWTCGAGKVNGMYFVKLGPLTFCLFRFFDEYWCFEMHWMNRLQLAVPDWRE